jgi:two-component system nitrogen regulation response regulator GlnG
MQLKILVVEDDKLFKKILLNKLSKHNVDSSENYKDALNKINSNKYDIAFIDLRLGENDNYSGLKLIPVSVSKNIYTVVMSASEEDEIVNKAYSLGCMDYYGKDLDSNDIDRIIDRYIKNIRTEQNLNPFKNEFITYDEQMLKQLNELLQYSSTDIPILILGETGTGKTKLAEVIHKYSQRKGNFVPINCSSYTEELLEAELFGYKKGAFTGAYEDKKGKLLEANNGTLFLDEIGTITNEMQTKLLKVIEEKKFYPLGSNKLEYSDFRIISATNEDIEKLVNSGKLRFDFFQRIHGFTIKLKPLSERKKDVFPLIKHFSGIRKLAFSNEARKFIENYSWPGNIRELRKFVEMLLVKSKGTIDLNTVKECLNQNLNTIKDNKNDDYENLEFVTGKQYDYALKYGLPNAIDRFAKEIILRNLSINKTKTKTMSELKISTRFFYSILKRVENERYK